MTKKILYTIIASIAIIAVCGAFLGKNTDEVTEVSTDKHSGIKWMTMEEALAANKKHPRKIVIDVYTEWCGWCKKMDKSTFADAGIVEYVNKKYYAVKLDAESTKAIEFQGQKMTEAELAGRIFGATGYPTTVYLDEKNALLSPVPGYLDVANFDKILKFFGEDIFKTKSWEQYNAPATK